MSGDLSLSRALGGLRIANPDDVVSSPVQEQSPPPESRLPEQPAGLGPRDYDQIQQSFVPQSVQPSQSDSGFVNGGSAADRVQRQPYNSASTLLPPQYNDGSSQVQPHSPNRSDGRFNGPSAPTASFSALPLPTQNVRPVSGVYLSQSPGDPDLITNMYNGLQGDASRPSVYAHAPRSDPRSTSAYPAPTASREASRSISRSAPLPPGSGPLPPRRSSKGMGGGYASSSVSLQPANDLSNPDLPLPTTSEEWQERGASVSTRREVDQEGRTVIRTVKKGVRDFTFGRVLGEGSYSTVFLATDRQTLREYAIKVLEKKHIIKEKKIKYVNIEKNTLNRLTEHPGIVRLYYTFQDETSLYYVLDLCNGGELLGVLKKTGTFDVECTRFYGAQILDAIDYMHSRGVIHRDLKPENVLLDDRMHIKITDFGTAKLLPDPRDPRPVQEQDLTRGGGKDDRRNASFVGTAEYVSPELLTEKSAGKPSDLWAFGCIIYQLLAGRPPFKAASEYLTFQKIVGLDYQFPAGFPPAARDLVERCLVLDPARRLTIEHIKNHEFFDGQKFGKELWRTKAPRLKPFVPPGEEPHVINLNGSAATVNPIATPNSNQTQANGTRQPARLITELPPPSQLDIEWSPVLTRNNERILKLGDLMVVSSPIPGYASGREGDNHKKLSRFFGGSTTKKRQRLVMITSSGRIILAPSGGDEKKAKQEISLFAPDCSWRTQIDVKGQSVWCVEAAGIRYVFEEPKSPQSSELGKFSVDDWVESLEQAKDMAISQNLVGSYNSDNGFGDLSSSMSSPASTLGGRGVFPEGFSVSDRSGRHHLNKSQGSFEDVTPAKRHRFSKRQSKNPLGAAGLGAAF